MVYCLRDRESKLRHGVQEDPVVTCVDTILHAAVICRASDIHLEPFTGGLRVRYRIDGALYDQEPIEESLRPSVLSRLKVLSSLDIAEKRLPQDGKLRAVVELWGIATGDETTTIDMRIATFPSVHGEKMVVRLLDRDDGAIGLHALGMDEATLTGVERMIGKSHGLIITTGPTGSGKTTTLYALLSRLNNSDRNIVTMEDPVERMLPGITQSQVNTRAGFTFENGLRALLRQDPDIIMIGEIRDVPTARIAIEAGLTGHLVLSTLHTNDAAGAVTRLLDMGIEPFLINASLVGVLAQRLVRRLCEGCKREVELDVEQRKAFVRYGKRVKKAFEPVGCTTCVRTGYYGRAGIFELLDVDETMREMILERTPASRMRAVAERQGMKVLASDAVEKVRQGATSYEEFCGVVVE